MPPRKKSGNFVYSNRGNKVRGKKLTKSAVKTIRTKNQKIKRYNSGTECLYNHIRKLNKQFQDAHNRGDIDEINRLRCEYDYYVDNDWVVKRPELEIERLEKERNFKRFLSQFYDQSVVDRIEFPILPEEQDRMIKKYTKKIIDREYNYLTANRRPGRPRA